MVTKVVRLILTGNTLSVAPWVPAIESRLTVTRRLRNEPEVARRTRQQFKYTKEPMFYVEPGGVSGHTHAPMLPYIQKLLKKHNIESSVEDHREPLPEPDFSRLTKKLRDTQAEALCVVAASRGGVIECPTGWGKSFLITRLSEVYPGTRILVTTRAAQVVKSLYERISEDCDDQVISRCGGGKAFKDHSDIVVCSQQSLHHVPKEWPGLVLFDEVHNASTATTVPELVKFNVARRFGFSASPTGRGDNADRYVEALFGPTIINIPYASAVGKDLVGQITVLIKQVDGVEIPSHASEVKMQREGYWENFARNKAIASVVKEVVRPEDQIMITVKTVEHALRLSRFLPDFHLVYDTVTPKKWDNFIKKKVTPEKSSGRVCRNPDVDGLRVGFEKGEVKRVITTIWKEGVDFTHLKYLLRADAMSGIIPSTQLPGRLSRGGGGTLIDFMDAYGSTYMARSQQRIAIYTEKGWDVQYI